MRFVADPAKAVANRRDHGITFAEAATAIDDTLGLEWPDDVHAERWLIIGRSDRGQLLVVVYVLVTPDLARIISARRATPHERKSYEEA